MMASKTRSSQKVLALELKRLEDEPVEGFTISLVNDSNLYEWKCIIFGPPDTMYAGAYFKALIHRVENKGPKCYIYFKFTILTSCI